MSSASSLPVVLALFHLLTLVSKEPVCAVTAGRCVECLNGKQILGSSSHLENSCLRKSWAFCSNADNTELKSDYDMDKQSVVDRRRNSQLCYRGAFRGTVEILFLFSFFNKSVRSNISGQAVFFILVNGSSWRLLVNLWKGTKRSIKAVNSTKNPHTSVRQYV